MIKHAFYCRIWIGLSCLISLVSLCYSQTVSSRQLARNIIVPQIQEIAPPHRHIVQPIQITKVNAKINIQDQIATTTIWVSLQNNSNRRQEAEIIMPVPNKAVIRGFDFQGKGSEPSAEIISKEEARRIFNEIVRKLKDPAIMEFLGCNLIRSCVFPVEPHGQQKVQITYEQILSREENRFDYLLPRSEAISYNVPWEIEVDLQSKTPISTVYSSSHDIQVERKSDKHINIKTTHKSTLTPGSFQLSYLTATNGLSASMYCYPDVEIGGGYFMLLAGLPAKIDKEQLKSIKREVTLVIDRSGSMNGEKIEQVREAALQIIAGLDDGELFNIITYQNATETFSDHPVLKTSETESQARAFINAIKPVGGTNIYDALLEALNQPAIKGTLPIVLFLTDGLPTVGNTAETDIRNLVKDHNQYNRRIFSFGVGVDVNAPLLEKIAEISRATTTFVLPKEDVEVKVGKVFKRLHGPVMTGPELTILNKKGKEAHGRTMDILPVMIPDLFYDDQIILIGKYIGTKPLTFSIKGNYLGKEKEFTFKSRFNHATTKNAFVPRLWASRKIAEMIDTIRQMGADQQIRQDDPRIKELVDEIVRLSTKYGILTEYTAFLAREGTDLAEMPAVHHEAASIIGRRGMDSRSGYGGVNQSFNMIEQKKQSSLNPRNSYVDEEMREVNVNNVQQLQDRAYYLRESQWVDSHIVSQKRQPDRTITVGTNEFFELASRLAEQNRQGTFSLRGDIIVEIDGEVILVTNN